MSPRSSHRRLALGAAAAVVISASASCSSTDPATPPDPTGSCSALASACHPYSAVAGLGRDCHELGHSGTDAACAEKKEECLAACPPVAKEDSGAAPPDAAPPDAAPDAAIDPACTALCDCLGATCSAVTNYPYADTAACLHGCSTLSVEAKTCYPKWCAKAKAEASPAHFCEHAWGKLGTVECDTL